MGRVTLFLIFAVFLTWKESEACFSASFNKTVYVRAGTSYYNECECNEPGYSLMHLQWLDTKNRAIERERPGKGQKVYTVRNEGCCLNLHIPFMAKGLSGVYKCRTTFKGKQYEQIHYIEAYDPITINPDTKQFLILNNKSLIKCKVLSEPRHVSPVVSWKKEGEIIEIGDKYILSEEGLYVNNVTMEDKGTYGCTAWDPESADVVEKNIDVEIVTKPVLTELLAIPGTKLVAGNQLIIECKADGEPTPEYVFEKIDGASTNSSRWEQHYNTILIKSLLPQDQGTYKCQAQSMAGVDNKTISITVLVAPTITSFPNMTVQEGETIVMTCAAEGRPKPNTSIIFAGNGKNMDDLDESDIIDSGPFKVNRGHSGVYACNATNKVDYEIEFMYLNVECKPRFYNIQETVWGWDGKVVNLSCAHHSNPVSQLSWRFQGDEVFEVKDLLHELDKSGAQYVTVNVSEGLYPYGKYACHANNKLGEDSKEIYFKEGHVPPVILNASLASLEHTSAKFDIEAPTQFEGPFIRAFTVEYDTEDNYDVTHIHINRTWPSDRPFTIDALDPNTTYLLRFAAINEVGYGPWSELLRFQTLEPSSPSTPEWEDDSDFVNITSMNQEVRWFPSEENGAPIQYYTVQYCLEEEIDLCNEVRIAANEDLKLDNSLLDFNTTYFINLTAYNSVGASAPANLTVIMLAESLTPQALLSAGTLIGISVVVVFICLLLLDLLLLLWRRQGIIASCCVKKKSKADENLQTRDKKGLLKDNREPEEPPKNDNKHKEFEYNKTTGIITGRHSAV